MITLQQVFDTLASGELSQIHLGQSTFNTISEEDYPKLVHAVNLGLLDLFKKFTLRKQEFKVHQRAGVNKYVLRKEHAGSLAEISDEIYIELMDGESWPNDLLAVLNLWETDGTPIPLNDTSFRYNVAEDTSVGQAEVEAGGFLLSHDTIRMNPRTEPIIFYAEYKARHEQIVMDERFDPTKIELDIPDFIEEPLLFYVASRIFRGQSSKASEGETTSAITFHALYTSACIELAQSGLITPTIETIDNSNFERNGWV